MRVGISIRLFTPHSGGLQHHAARLVEQLISRGHEVVVVTRAVSKVPSFQELFWFSDPEHSSSSNVSVVKPNKLLLPLLWLSYKFCGRKYLRFLGIFLYKLVYQRQMRDMLKGCDIIHHVGQGSELIGFAAEGVARCMGVPFVVQPTIHPGQWGDSPIDFRLYAKADRLLVHTQYERRFFEEHCKTSSIDVVGNGIDDRRDGVGTRFRKTYQIAGKMVLFLGRKEKDKGYPLLKEAFPMLKQDATLVCIGPGEEVRASSGADTSAKRQIELGFVTDDEKHDALAACDVFCVPSEGESFGLVFMEAGRYRKPIVCRRIPVLEELLPQAAYFLGECGTNGHVPLDPSTLAASLDTLLANRLERCRLGEEAFTASNYFLWYKVADRFCDAYQRTLRKTDALR